MISDMEKISWKSDRNERLLCNLGVNGFSEKVVKSEAGIRKTSKIGVFGDFNGDEVQFK